MALADNTDHSRHIPEAIIDDILIRLPIRDLLRSKPVCKCWYSLITSPRFISSHLDRTISDPSRHFILVRFNDEPEPPVLRNTANPVVRCIPRMEGIILVGSINGLVCLVDGDNDKVNDIWIWNPATGKFKKLPLGSYNACRVCRRVTFGFGWDPEDNVYKLAKLVYGDSGSCCEVWCSDSDSWSEIELNNEILRPGHATSSSDVTVKGGLVCYWIVCNTIDYELVVDGMDLEFAVASFDMSTEVLQITPFPALNVSYEQLENDFSSCNVFGINWRENFGLVKRRSCGIQERYKVWTLNDTDGGWTNELDLGLNPSPEGCLDSSNEKLVLVVGQRLILLDMKTGAIQDLGLARDCVGEARFYLESFVSLEGFIPCPEE